jgi:feruloyl-CoA synthase
MPTAISRPRFGGTAVSLERDAVGGTLYLCSPQPLTDYPEKLTERLHLWAEQAPARTFLAERTADGDWRRLSYAQALAQVRALAQALLERKLSPERPLLVLSDNGIDHALLGLAAQYIGVPYAPISSAYSLVSSDYAKLRHVIELLSPGLVYAADGVRFGAAIEATLSDDIEVVVSANAPTDRRATLLADLAATDPTPAVDAAHRSVGADTTAKFLFTSGSTAMPKAVINTQRMLCSNQQSLRTVFAFLAEEPPVLLDWLPWNHTFGGNHNFNMVLFNGGSLYIDDGRPTPGRRHAQHRAQPARDRADPVLQRAKGL